MAFFRSVGGAIGVSVLGAVLGNRVKELATEGLAKAGIPVTGGSAGASMDLKDMPAPIRDIMRAAYGDATAQIFLISAIIGIVALIAILLIKESPLRRTVDILPAPAAGGAGPGTGTTRATAAAAAATAAATPDGGPAAPDGVEAGSGLVDLDQEFIEVLSRQRDNRTRFPEAAGRDAARLRARTLVADARADTADVVPVLLRTQQLLVEQQVQLAEALRAVHEQAAEQRAITAEQARVTGTHHPAPAAGEGTEAAARRGRIHRNPRPAPERVTPRHGRADPADPHLFGRCWVSPFRSGDFVQLGRLRAVGPFGITV